MKIFLLTQYFTVTLVVTITIGLFTLKPVVAQNTATTQVVNVTNNTQGILINDIYK